MCHRDLCVILKLSKHWGPPQSTTSRAAASHAPPPGSRAAKRMRAYGFPPILGCVRHLGTGSLHFHSRAFSPAINPFTNCSKPSSPLAPAVAASVCCLGCVWILSLHPPVPPCGTALSPPQFTKIRKDGDCDACRTTAVRLWYIYGCDANPEAAGLNHKGTKNTKKHKAGPLCSFAAFVSLW